MGRGTTRRVVEGPAVAPPSRACGARHLPIRLRRTGRISDLEPPAHARHDLVPVEVDAELVGIGNAFRLEVDLGVGVLRVTVLEPGERVRADLLLDARTRAPAVDVEALLVLDLAVGAEEVVAGVGVAGLGVDQRVGGRLEARARANVDVAARLDAAEA